MIDWLKLAKEQEENILRDLAGWIKIKSDYDESTVTKEMPFGKGVDSALKYIVDLANKDGFETVNDEGYACHIDHGSGSEIMGILGHADVVSEGVDWEEGPYSATIKNGFMYGRGTQDDKGPMMAAYYAMKIIKEQNLPVSKKIRMIVGGNEESGWECVNHYFKNYPKPNFGFTPDGEFPLIYAEKNILNYEFYGEYKCNEIISITSGNAVNMVPDRAQCIATLDFTNEFNTFLSENNLKGSVSTSSNQFTYIVEGISAHGAMPEKGINAASFLLQFLAKYFDNKMVKYFANGFSDYYGKAMNINHEHKELGVLTNNLGLVSYENGKYSFLTNIRYTTDLAHEVLFEKLEKFGTNLDWESNVKNQHLLEGLQLDLNSPFIKTLHNAYIEFTNDTTTKAMSIGGGTFARACPNVVCFGMLFPESKDLMHQRNEAVKIDELITATAIYAKAIYDSVK